MQKAVVGLSEGASLIYAVGNDGIMHDSAQCSCTTANAACAQGGRGTFHANSRAQTQACTYTWHVSIRLLYTFFICVAFGSQKAFLERMRQEFVILRQAT